MTDAWPADREPDGAVEGPHHYYIGIGLVVSIAATHGATWTLAVALAGAFGFGFVWPFYPRVGATVSGWALPAVATAAGVELAGVAFALAVASTLIGADDWVEHAYGRSTPLDTAWRRWLLPWIRAGESRE